MIEQVNAIILEIELVRSDATTLSRVLVMAQRNRSPVDISCSENLPVHPLVDMRSSQ
jgi:hypothetical protein